MKNYIHAAIAMFVLASGSCALESTDGTLESTNAAQQRTCPLEEASFDLQGNHYTVEVLLDTAPGSDGNYELDMIANDGDEWDIEVQGSLDPETLEAKLEAVWVDEGDGIGYTWQALGENSGPIEADFSASQNELTIRGTFLIARETLYYINGIPLHKQSTEKTQSLDNTLEEHFDPSSCDTSFVGQKLTREQLVIAIGLRLAREQLAFFNENTE
ncbi:MAG: hypothetical protein IPJ88_09355 [Myxococcales bacterium]|nr:MAG: hypothetical protein IPJ88_09355 [Myxococcales bacterium]